MANHTPGPWVEAGRYGLIGVEVHAGSRSLAVVNRVQANRLDGLNKIRSKAAQRGEQAHDAEKEAQELEQSLSRAIADARLIAAAPDLLACCVAMLALHDCGSWGAPPGEYLPALRAAIAKAEGAR
jgi:hypothetical protein